MGNRRLVGIGEMIVSDDKDDILVASSLGSCLGVAVYDPRLRLGGMIHCLLPLSQADAAKAKERPCLYVDTGVTLLLETMFARGATKRGIAIYVGGGSAINDSKGVFEIGSRNFTALRKLLWKNNLLLTAADVGGECSRTVSLVMETGEVWVRKNGQEAKLQQMSRQSFMSASSY